MKNLSIANALLAALCLLPVSASAQEAAAAAKSAPSAAAVTDAGVNPAAPPAEMARAVIAAQGGDSFRNLKSLILKGSGVAYSPLSTQAAPVDFIMVSNEMGVRIEMKAPFGTIYLINDGEQYYTLFAGQRGTFGLAPPSKFGLGVLAHLDQQGRTVGALPAQKEPGFRVTDAQSNATDFYIEPATGHIARYEYKYGDYVNSWEQKDFRKVEGVLIPHRLTMKLGSRVGDYYAEFKVKEVQVNPQVGASTFVPPSTLPPPISQ
jgi:hypothetical protein